MKVEELRKGNYILGCDETEIDRGNGIYEDVEIEEIVQFIGYDPFEGWFWTEGGDREEYRHFQEIPLTEDWLLRLGFEYVMCEDGIDGFARNGFAFINIQQFRMLVSGDEYAVLIEHDIQYVHQLQNLYFALTGDELTLKK